ncbi:hypothetical protein KJ652_04385 [Patescibacteria group bacterium]|nr:hypothetical protein [Patescibacteria group bacterium]MBU1123805.1 hypothetical protein [Patescibacteria group bacterium]MBU1911698.1 hypothetical protein [Patescibacteria group bacterium]
MNLIDKNIQIINISALSSAIIMNIDYQITGHFADEPLCMTCTELNVEHADLDTSQGKSNRDPRGLEIVAGLVTKERLESGDCRVPAVTSVSSRIVKLSGDARSLLDALAKSDLSEGNTVEIAGQPYSRQYLQRVLDADVGEI